MIAAALRWIVALLVGLFFSCASASVAEKRADGTFVLEYLAQGMESIVSERRADAMMKAKISCGEKSVSIEKEWDSTVNTTGFGMDNRRHLLVRCIDATDQEAMVIARARAETGCEAPTAESPTQIGQATVFRVNACGTHLVCDLEGAGVTCKRALAQTEAP